MHCRACSFQSSHPGSAEQALDDPFALAESSPATRERVSEPPGAASDTDIRTKRDARVRRRQDAPTWLTAMSERKCLV